MPFQRAYEFAHGLESASKGGCHPSPDEAFGSPHRLVIPELFKFIFELPGSVDSAVGLVQRPQRARILARAS